MPAKIRRATLNDSDQIATIYRPIVEDTAISFEADPPGSEEMALGFEQIGIFKESGFKFDCWHDVAMWQRAVKSEP